MAARKSRGTALVESIRADMAALGCEPTSTEEEALLQAAAETADRIERLEAVIAKEGELVRAPRLRVHPAVPEVRMQRTALARILGGVYLGDSTTTPRKDPKKQRAARVRHDREQRREAS